MKRMLLPLILVIFVLFGCSGEGYVKVANLTPSSISVSVNDEANVLLAAGDTTDAYSIELIKGTIANVSVEATGDWIGDYTNTVSVADGELVVHTINPTLTQAYVQAVNLTISPIYISIDDQADVVLNPGDTTDMYSVEVTIGSTSNINIEATGDWIGTYETTVSLTNQDTVVHPINATMANITITNTSIDSAMCLIENNEIAYFEGKDSINAYFMVDGSVETEYGGRYMFLEEETKSWFPSSQYRFELIPNACEIQLNNIHPNRTIYYVYLSQSSDETWGEDDLGDDMISPMEGYIWKAEGDVMWDMRLEASDPHPDSAMYVYEFYDVSGSASDITHIYEFPTIFSPVVGKIAKADGGKAIYKKQNSLNKSFVVNPEPVRLEKVRKVRVNNAQTNVLMKR